jgi:hypothetical protein
MGGPLHPLDLPVTTAPGNNHLQEVCWSILKSAFFVVLGQFPLHADWTNES